MRISSKTWVFILCVLTLTVVAGAQSKGAVAVPTSAHFLPLIAAFGFVIGRRRPV